MRTRADIECWLTDMDGVLVHENTPDSRGGRAAAAVARRRARRSSCSRTTRSSRPRDLSARLRASGLDRARGARSGPRPSRRPTSCTVAGARGTAFVIGEAGPHDRAARGRLHHDRDRSRLRRGRRDAQLLVRGDHQGDPLHRGRCALHRDQPRRDRPVGRRRRCPRPGRSPRSSRRRSARSPTSSGKPNPMMFRSALNRIGAHSENTGMIGDRMDTDIVAGIEAGPAHRARAHRHQRRAEIERYPFRPDEVLDSVADLLADEPIETDCPRCRRSSDGRTRRRRAGRGAGCRDLARLARGEPRDLEGRLARAAPSRVGPRARRLRGRDPARRCASAGSTARCASFDEQTGGLWFAPRRPSSGWAATNKARLILLERARADGRGRASAPSKSRRRTARGRCSTTPRRCVEPDDLAAALDADPAARASWDAFPPSARKFGIARRRRRAHGPRRAPRASRRSSRMPPPGSGRYDRVRADAAVRRDRIVLRRHAHRVRLAVPRSNRKD